MVVIDRVATRDNELHLPSVVAPRGEKPVAGQPSGRVVSAANDPRLLRRVLSDPRPKSRRRMKKKKMNVAMSGERAQNLEMAGRQTSEPEQRDALRHVDESRIPLEIRARALDALSWIGYRNTRAKPPPKLSLPSSIGRDSTLATCCPSTN